MAKPLVVSTWNSLPKSLEIFLMMYLVFLGFLSWIKLEKRMTTWYHQNIKVKVFAFVSTNANSINTSSATSRAYVQSSSNPLEIFHYLCKSFTDFEHTLGSLTLVFKILQETTSLLITTEFLRWTERFLPFRVDDTNWRS